MRCRRVHSAFIHSQHTNTQKVTPRTKHKTFTPRTHNTRFIIMLATCIVLFRVVSHTTRTALTHRHDSESP